ncbi:MAG: T9SS type A sorting domain-containing protein [Candidatus Cloacimonetes bacterium]|nr:T9SS type A sorting domain-containing protein [Candidatus Cloacimonadota bacterium]
MKKALIFFCVLLWVASLFAAQRFVVGEVYTQSWCVYCPNARSALKTVADNESDFPFFIPLIWQGDTAYASPGYSARGSLYGFSGIPHVRMGGSNQIGNYTSIPQYLTAYNTHADSPSPIQLDIFKAVVGNNITITADVSMLEDITGTNKIIFVMTNYQSDTYFSSVVRYELQDFPLTTTGQSNSYEATFTIDPAWDLESVNLVVFIQNTAGNKEIHQAGILNMGAIMGPTNVITYSSATQITFKWDAPNVEETIIGYNVYKNDTVINVAMIEEQQFTDSAVAVGFEYDYYITGITDEGDETRPSPTYHFVPVGGSAQIGSGNTSTASNNPSPINIQSNSLRGQTLYTASDLLLAGVPAGNIYSLAFNVKERPIRSLPNYHIRIKHTEATNLTAHDDGPWTSTTVIPSYTPFEDIWDRQYLSTPFEWDGVRNIVIDTAFDMLETPHGSGQIAVINSMSGYRYVTSNTASMTDSPTTLLANYKPQIVLGLNPFSTHQREPINLSHRTITSPIFAIQIMWERPIYTETPLVRYRVFRDDVELNTSGAITNPQFMDLNASPTATWYTYKVLAVFTDGESLPVEIIVPVTETSIVDPDTPVLATRLESNYPNPFNPSTTIYYELNESSQASIEVYNIKGQLIKTLVNNHHEAGRHTVIWDGTDNNNGNVSAGVYLYRLKTNNYEETKRMIMVK